MNPNYGYQLYQAQRFIPRAEILAGDARRGRQAAATRGTRRLAGGARAAGGCQPHVDGVHPRGFDRHDQRRSPGRS